MKNRESPTCCPPSTKRPARSLPERTPAAIAGTAVDGSGFVELAGGRFLMGNPRNDGYVEDGESPVHPVVLAPFAIARNVVTNGQFAAFVAESGYQTDAERYEWSFVFAGLLPDGFPPTAGVVAAPWWRQVAGASWQAPEGPSSSVDGRRDHPVIHVSWNDAMAFCAWERSRLPTEAEWEYAARGGIVSQPFPWGSALLPDGEHRMNVWQGAFPSQNTGEDGYLGTAPARSFSPNGFGLFNMTGNVWEWCADWFSPSWYAASPVENPTGPAAGTARVMRGGSYLCHDSYCNRYRVDARSSSTSESSAGNVGFRTVRDL